MKFGSPYWGPFEKIELLSKWILVHSILYYELNTNLVEDNIYDSNGKQLAELLRLNRNEARRSKWSYVFEGYEGNTGFYLIDRLSPEQYKDLRSIAEYLERRYNL